MAKRIVVLSDGTGNAASSIWRTNVWRTFQALDLVGNEQVARYDDGVGSSSFLPGALIGGAFGFGLKRNVIDLYKFVCRNHTANSSIYAFGFSRGAFTVRVLVGFILNQGLVRFESESDLDAKARNAYRAYRAQGYHTRLRVEWPFRKLRDGWLRLTRLVTGRPLYDQTANVQIPEVAFLGVWDTVSAYGLPIEEMTRGVSQWIWPLALPDRVLNPRVRRACHALAIDDERTTFHPVLWTEAGERRNEPDGDGRLWLKGARISQVWFCGMHSNVGGGYPDDALAHIPLYWMMERAKEQHLVFKTTPDAMQAVCAAMDKDGRMYDSRSGLGVYYRYGPRKIADLCNVRSKDRQEAVEIREPKIHASVLQRIGSNSTAYAPLGLPSSYAVVSDQGEILKQDAVFGETSTQAANRLAAQEVLWNWVWLHRLVYFAMVAAFFHLIAFWWFHERVAQDEFKSKIRIVSEFMRAMESLIPRGLHWWTHMYVANPEWFVGGIAILALLILIGSRIKRRTGSKMRRIWLAHGAPALLEQSAFNRKMVAVRLSAPYRTFIWLMKRWVLPAFSAVFLLWLGVGWLSHLVVNLADSAGLFCRENATGRRALNYDGAEATGIRFRTNDPCAHTGVSLEANRRYEITFTVTTPWADRGFPTDPKGFNSSAGPRAWNKAFLYAGVPFRRVIFRGWFHPIARVGATGTAEYFLDPYKRGGSFVGVLKTERSGELFLYVNDAFLALPYLHRIFYSNNTGEAIVKVRRL